MPMFDRLIAFLRDLPGTESSGNGLSADDPRIAAAALMFHVMDADGIRQPEERERLVQLLRETYPMDDEALNELVNRGEAADREAIDLYAFTSVLKRNLDAAGRAGFVRLMWEIVYADGERHELEENVVWRIAELIGVETPERVAMRQSVEREAGLRSDD